MPRAPRLLLADADGATRHLLVPLLEELSAEVVEAADGSALEAKLLSGQRFHLVIASARLPGPSALEVLARVRRLGASIPFVVVTSVHGKTLRIFVSDSEGTVLSSRVVDSGNLVSLITELVAHSA